jgi:hypothetical protein
LKAEAHREHPERALGHALGEAHHEQRAEHHARQARAEDEGGAPVVELALARVPDGGAHPQRYRRDLVGGERGAEGEPEEQEQRQLQEPRASAGERGQRVGEDRGGEQRDLVEHGAPRIAFPARTAPRAACAPPRAHFTRAVRDGRPGLA